VLFQLIGGYVTLVVGLLVQVLAEHPGQMLAVIQML
jgi:hypothetical protein